MGKVKSGAAKAARKSKRKARRVRFDWWKLPWLLLIPLGLCYPRICEGRAELIEHYYCSSVYPVIKDALSVMTTLVPISIAELILYALLLGVAIELTGTLIAWFFRRVNGKRMLSVLCNVGILVGVLLNLFYFTWGFNYFRQPLSVRMGLPVKARSVTELAVLTDRLAAEANRLRVSAPEDASGVVTFTTDLQTTLNDLPVAYERLSASSSLFSVRTTRAKRVLYSEGLSWAGIAGIYIGLTAEPNVNVAQPMILIPQGAAHEMAHQMGIASEDEAEFVGYLACLASDDSAVRYSGVMNALIHCQNALHDADADAAEAILKTYSDAVRRDLVAYDAYWDMYEGPVEDAVDKTNDAYLKHNAQESGIQSYGEVVDLLLAHYDLTIS